MAMNNPYQSQLCHAVSLNSTEQAISKAFLYLYQRMDFEHISITAICRHAQISRPTFYRYFSNTWEIKEVLESNFVADLLHVSYQLKFFDFANPSYPHYLKAMRNFLQANRETFKAFLVTNPSPTFIHKYKVSIKYHYFREHYFSDLDLEIIASYLITVFTYTLANNIPITLDQADHYDRQLGRIIAAL
ncbi:TetR/AcrR family transcriptional regulator [Limosilactobacillus kribbianus]|uniref:TetR/AcrR family transcriptional regulator n=1 Tax=Limosilactobacillus kribbianus TaxID=2982695 RepID=UPI002264D848|nr:TetR/AcrR family transcriptional regulator [Limosilactobacillus kribbianus]